MKKSIIIIILALAGFVIASAQSTNPLNYSGRMYVEAMEAIVTPRYVSYEDHAILSRQMHVPSVEITRCDMDFEKGTVTVKDNKMKMKVSDCRKYDTDQGWVVVVYVVLDGTNDKAELVWPEYGKPYFQQISKDGGRVRIARMILSRTPYVADEQEVMRAMVMGLINEM